MRLQLCLGKRAKATPHPRHWGRREGLTQRGHEREVLQHHVAVQEFLTFIKEVPFVPREVHGHILKGHILRLQSGQVTSPTACLERPTKPSLRNPPLAHTPPKLTTQGRYQTLVPAVTAPSHGPTGQRIWPSATMSKSVDGHDLSSGSAGQGPTLNPTRKLPESLPRRSLPSITKLDFAFICGRALGHLFILPLHVRIVL